MMPPLDSAATSFIRKPVIRNHGVRAFGKVAILLIYSNLINILLKLLG